MRKVCRKPPMGCWKQIIIYMLQLLKEQQAGLKCGWISYKCGTLEKEAYHSWILGPTEGSFPKGKKVIRKNLPPWVYYSYGKTSIFKCQSKQCWLKNQFCHTIYRNVQIVRMSTSYFLLNLIIIKYFFISLILGMMQK
jgi:hypothetical protein